MERTYIATDNIVNNYIFDTWIMSAEGVKRIHNHRSSNLDIASLYRFRDATISYSESGNHRDGSQVLIKIEGDNKRIFSQICSSLERNFPRINLFPYS